MATKWSKSGKGKGSKKLSFLERLVIKITIPSKITREVIKGGVSYGVSDRVRQVSVSVLLFLA
ncbi:hypothetical protein ES705_22925 [subsurface metagenome]